MRQTPPQIRLGGYLSLAIGIANILIFGLFSLGKHTPTYVLASLPMFIITVVLGIYFITQAERIAASRLNPKATTPPSAHNAEAFQMAGRVFLATGAGLFVVFTALAIITHIAAFFLTTIAPAIIFISIGGIYLLTSFPVKK